MAIDFQQTQPMAAFPKFTDHKAAFPKSPEALVKQTVSQAPLSIIRCSRDSNCLVGGLGNAGLEGMGAMTLFLEMVVLKQSSFKQFFVLWISLASWLVPFSEECV